MESPNWYMASNCGVLERAEENRREQIRKETKQTTFISQKDVRLAIVIFLVFVMIYGGGGVYLYIHRGFKIKKYGCHR